MGSTNILDQGRSSDVWVLLRLASLIARFWACSGMSEFSLACTVDHDGTHLVSISQSISLQLLQKTCFVEDFERLRSFFSGRRIRSTASSGITSPAIDENRPRAAETALVAKIVKCTEPTLIYSSSCVGESDISSCLSPIAGDISRLHSGR